MSGLLVRLAVLSLVAMMPLLMEVFTRVSDDVIKLSRIPARHAQKDIFKTGIQKAPGVFNFRQDFQDERYFASRCSWKRRSAIRNEGEWKSELNEITVCMSRGISPSPHDIARLRYSLEHIKLDDKLKEKLMESLSIYDDREAIISAVNSLILYNPIRQSR